MSGEGAVERAVTERVAAIRDRIGEAARRAGRDPDEITVLGVCKRQPIERIAAAVRAGIDELGENYVQEAQRVRAALEPVLGADVEPPRWCLVGGLQRNKARAAVDIFDRIETVDRASLAAELDKRMRSRRPEAVPLPVLIQVNLSREPQKGGVVEEELEALIAACADLRGIQLTGLMTIPAATDDPERRRPDFARLRELRDRWAGSPGCEALHDLSMGMSADFEIAIAEGATRVRIGTALFGERQERA